MIYALDGIRPTIHPSAWVAPTAVLIGDVTLEADASVWFGAVLRGDNEPILIGRGSNVQENVVMHTDPGCPLRVGEDVTVGHKALLHGCTVGNGALVGMGATMLNRAVLGEGSLLGAGALLTEGRTVEPGHLAVGAPAKAARALDEAAREGLLASARHYVANAARFRAGLEPS